MGGDPAFGQIGRQRQEGCPRLAGAEQRRDVIDAGIEEQPDDGVAAGCDSGGAQGVGDAVGPAVQRVVGDALAARLDRDGVPRVSA